MTPKKPKIQLSMLKTFESRGQKYKNAEFVALTKVSGLISPSGANMA